MAPHGRAARTWPVSSLVDAATRRAGASSSNATSPGEAIICAFHNHDDDFNEAEYLVDRRRLPRNAVRVIARSGLSALTTLLGR
jgi:hypothetical protein